MESHSTAPHSPTVQNRRKFEIAFSQSLQVSITECLRMCGSWKKPYFYFSQLWKLEPNLRPAGTFLRRTYFQVHSGCLLTYGHKGGGKTELPVMSFLETQITLARFLHLEPNQLPKASPAKPFCARTSTRSRGRTWTLTMAIAWHCSLKLQTKHTVASHPTSTACILERASPNR